MSTTEFTSYPLTIDDLPPFFLARLDHTKNEAYQYHIPVIVSPKGLVFSAGVERDLWLTFKQLQIVLSYSWTTDKHTFYRFAKDEQGNILPATPKNL